MGTSGSSQAQILDTLEGELRPKIEGWIMVEWSEVTRKGSQSGGGRGGSLGGGSKLGSFRPRIDTPGCWGSLCDRFQVTITSNIHRGQEFFRENVDPGLPL
jgi:hypothetical protein